MNKKDPIIQPERGCITILTLISLAIIFGIVLGVVSCSENQKLKERIEELERDRSRFDEDQADLAIM